MKLSFLFTLIITFSSTVLAQENQGSVSVKKNHHDCLVVIGLKDSASDLALSSTKVDITAALAVLVELQYSNYHKMLDRLSNSKLYVSAESRKVIESLERKYHVSALTPQYCGYNENSPSQVWRCTREYLRAMGLDLQYLQQRVCEPPYSGI